MLLRLAEKTSHRVTLEILCNLPGLKEPNGEGRKPSPIWCSTDVSEDVLRLLDLVNISSYCSVFSAHLLLCLDRQALPVASDLVDFMLAKQMPVEVNLLHALLQKLGKQSLWLRARELFRRESYFLTSRHETSGCPGVSLCLIHPPDSLSQGYYQGVSAPPGFMALMVPCQLEEVELALAFEMFVTVNGSIILHPAETTSSKLCITLKR